jgi:hypothetical protein
MTSLIHHPAATDHRLPPPRQFPSAPCDTEFIPNTSSCRSSSDATSVSPTTPPASDRELPSTRLPRHGAHFSVSLLLPIGPKWVTLIAGYLSDPLPCLPTPSLTGMASCRCRSAMGSCLPYFLSLAASQVQFGLPSCGPC